MARVQKSVLGIDCEQTYNGYCPFFWVTWLCVLLLPFSFSVGWVNAKRAKVWRAFEGLVDKYFPEKPYLYKAPEKVPYVPSAYVIIQLEKFLEREKERGGGEIDWFMFTYDFCNLHYSTNPSEVEKWVEENPTWRETILPAAKKKWKAMEEEREAEVKAIKDKSDKRLVFVTKVSKIGQFIVKPILVAVALAVVALIYWVGSVVVANWTAIWQIFLLTGAVIAIFVGIVCGIVFLTQFLKGNKTVGRVAFTVLDFFGRRFDRFAKTIKKVSKAIAEGFKFLAQTVSMAYKAECPLIIWGDTTEKIQKNAKKDLDKKQEA